MTKNRRGKDVESVNVGEIFVSHVFPVWAMDDVRDSKWEYLVGSCGWLGNRISEKEVEEVERHYERGVLEGKDRRQ